MSTRRYADWTNSDIVYFHGTTKGHAEAILRDGIDPSLGSPNTDFGGQFYTTTNREQAEEWAETRASDTGDIAVVLRLKINRTALALLRNLSFVLPTKDYWSLVERCRDKTIFPISPGRIMM